MTKPDEVTVTDAELLAFRDAANIAFLYLKREQIRQALAAFLAARKDADCARAVAAEREACAKVAELRMMFGGEPPDAHHRMVIEHIAAAIRSRGSS